MGILRLRQKDLALAYENRALNERLQSFREPEEMLVHYRAQAKQKDIRLVPKSTLLGPQWQALTTTFPNSIRLGKGFDKKSATDKALIMAHEFVHVRQWDLYRNFGARYLGPRFGWAMEMQAYRESVRGRFALGFSQKEVERWIERMPDILWRNYLLLRQIQRRELQQATLEVLRSELC